MQLFRVVRRAEHKNTSDIPGVRRRKATCWVLSLLLASPLGNRTYTGTKTTAASGVAYEFNG